ncbi:MAG TPA: 50S ribosomal protein L21 [Candidatus Omnitrophota bacterium]|nr:50S ribosomal protein L21 [Candidatus Omnitrophota bacterium]
MYAIVKAKDKQYRLEAGNILEAENLTVEKGKEITLTDVLLIGDGDKITVGQPVIKGASVLCEVLDNVQGKKGLAFKFRRRESYRKRRGFRQLLTRIKVKEITLPK